MNPRPLQVLVRTHRHSLLIAGLPCAVRCAYRASRELAPERIIIVGADDAFMKRWSYPLRSSGTVIISDHFGAQSLNGGLPLLVLDDGVFPDENALFEFLQSAQNIGSAHYILHGRVVAAYIKDASSIGAGTLSPREVHIKAIALPLPTVNTGEIFDATTPDRAEQTAQILYARLAKPNDGYLARFDRRLSLALTQVMLPLPITPNLVTAASLLLGLVGAYWLAGSTAKIQFLGAFTLWFCALLDGCDGEIARLKLHMTELGGDFDLWADHAAHLATFIALPIGVARLNPGSSWWLPGSLLVAGFLTCGFSVWWLVLRLPQNRRGPLSLIVERIASRDYVYLILALTAIGHLEWFLWAAAFGSHAFCAFLWWTARLGPTPIGLSGSSE